ncbi:MAG: SCO family protein [Acidimicrobiia bacterium]|nr:SCO family protein [Acidimicrobiia bacterium]
MRRLLIAVVAIVVVGAAGFAVARQLRPHLYAGTVLQSPQPAPEFTLTTHNGDQVSPRDFGGDVVLLYFGYTHCPDVCPLTLSNVAKALDRIGSDAERVQLMMITVDPERDTPEVLDDYMGHFDETFLGLGGDPDEIARIAALYGVFYRANEGDVETGYVVDHTATLMAIDPTGALRVVYSPEIGAEALAPDLKELLG